MKKIKRIRWFKVDESYVVKFKYEGEIRWQVVSFTGKGPALLTYLEALEAKRKILAAEDPENCPPYKIYRFKHRK